jgi:small subunit ribosomal protein S9
MKKNANISLGTGRRKTAIARIYMRSGSGKITINGRDIDTYFPIDLQRQVVRSPLEACNVNGVDLVVNVRGGGLEGQAVAVRHALSRALVKADEDRRPVLKERGFLTRDPRKKERKKYGQPGARKRFQFCKR